MTNLPNTFAQYLTVEGNSPITIKNYLSDLNHFLAWMEITLKSKNLPYSEGESFFISRYFNTELVQNYRAYLLSNEIPTATVNRRLSTLRTFGKFCLSQGWVKENPTNTLSNQNPLRPVPYGTGTTRGTQSEAVIKQFKTYLEKEKTSAGHLTSSNTIKNYISDIREYLVWLELKEA